MKTISPRPAFALSDWNLSPTTRSLIRGKIMQSMVFMPAHQHRIISAVALRLGWARTIIDWIVK